MQWVLCVPLILDDLFEAVDHAIVCLLSCTCTRLELDSCFHDIQLFKSVSLGPMEMERMVRTYGVHDQNLRLLFS